MPKSRHIKRRTDDIDRAAAEAAYAAGEPVAAIARRAGVSPSTIWRWAKKHGWRRGKAVAPPKAAQQPRAGGTRANGPTPPLSATDELQRLSGLAGRLRARLERVIDGEPAEDLFPGTRESPAALLLKLCQISEKIITIERRLAGADDPTSSQLSEQDRDILDRFKRRYGVR